MARRSELRAHWHFLASLSPEQRQMAQGRAGLALSRMSPAQQQQFLSLLPDQPDRFPSLTELSQASLQVDYTPPGDYQWTPVARGATPAERMQTAPRVREHTREAALLAAQQLDPQVTEAQITPTEVALKLTLSLGGPQARFTPFVIHVDMHNLIATLPQAVAQ